MKLTTGDVSERPHPVPLDQRRRARRVEPGLEDEGPAHGEDRVVHHVMPKAWNRGRVALFARFELRRAAVPAVPAARAFLAALLLAAGMAGLTSEGFAGGGMMAGVGLVGGGWTTLRRR